MVTPKQLILPQFFPEKNAIVRTSMDSRVDLLRIPAGPMCMAFVGGKTDGMDSLGKAGKTGRFVDWLNSFKLHSCPSSGTKNKNNSYNSSYSL